MFTSKEMRPGIQVCNCGSGTVQVQLVAGQGGTREGAVTQHRLIENVGDAGWQLLRIEESVQETRPHCTTEMVTDQKELNRQSDIANLKTRIDYSQYMNA